jgi:hypothetical protein
VPDEPEAIPSKKKTAAPPRFPRAAAVGLAAVALGAVWWFSTRRAARRDAEAARSAAASLVACVARAQGSHPTLHAAIAWGFPDATPLAECAAPAAELARRTRALEEVRLLRDPDAREHLVRALDTIARFDLAERASALASRDLEPLASAVGAAARAACGIATLEADANLRKCGLTPPTPDAPALPVSRVAFQTALGVPLEALEVEADVRSERLSVALVGRERYAEHLDAWLLQSRDGGQSFVTATTTGPSEDPAPLRAPRIVFGADGTPRYLLLSEQKPKAPLHGLILAVEAGGTALFAKRLLPEIAPPFELVHAGTPLFELGTAAGKPLLAVALGRSGQGPGKILYLSGDDEVRERAAPGPLLGGSGRGEPRVITGEHDEKTGAISLAAYGIPLPGKPWPTPVRLSVPGASIVAESVPERACGVPEEKYFPFAVRSDDRARLVALGDSQLVSLPLEVPKRSALSPSCDSCPPTLFLRSEAPVLLLPAGSSVAKIPIRTPLAFGDSAVAKTAVSGCAHGIYALAYVARRALVVQTAKTGAWRFSAPRVIAEPNDDGDPVDPRIVGQRERLVIVFRREPNDHKRLRVEVLGSDDAGASWH